MHGGIHWRDRLLLDPQDLVWLETHRLERKVYGNYEKVVAVKRGGGLKRKRKWTIFARLILGAQEGQFIDHINGNTLDNRRCNLRFCTLAQNSANRLSIGGASKFKGVQQHAGRWFASITFAWETRSLGGYASEEDAARAFDAAAREIQGEFARLNFPRAGEVSALDSNSVRQGSHPDVAAASSFRVSPSPHFAWLCSVPGIPADWPSAQPIGSGNGLALAQLHGGMPLDMTFHKPTGAT